jgi:hypothetical protein
VQNIRISDILPLIGRATSMATTAPAGVRSIRSSEPKKPPLSREQEILEEFRHFIDAGIDAMSPTELEDYERKAEEIMKQARVRSSESASAHGKVGFSATARQR